MRTTVTLDPDVVTALHQIISERGISLSEALKDANREGLQSKRRAARRFSQKTFSMGAPQFPWEKAVSVADAIDDAELLRRIAIGKL